MNVREGCITILSEVLVQEGELDAAVAGGGLFSSGSLDSLMLVNLIVAIENRFSIQVDSDDFETIFATLDSFVAYVESKTI